MQTHEQMKQDEQTQNHNELMEQTNMTVNERTSKPMKQIKNQTHEHA